MEMDQLFLSNLGNYLADSWNSGDGCLECWDDRLEFQNLVETPKLVMAFFIEKPTKNVYDKLSIGFLVICCLNCIQCRIIISP